MRNDFTRRSARSTVPAHEKSGPQILIDRPVSRSLARCSGKLACSPVKPSGSSATGGVSSHVTAAGRLPSARGVPVGVGVNPLEDGGVDESPESEDEPPQQKRTLKRQLTKHVVTRWYRAPELILLQVGGLAC